MITLFDIFVISALCNGETRVEVQGQDPEAPQAARRGLEIKGDLVLDRSTGLLWSRENVGKFNWKDAHEACQKLTLGGFSDWRLPTIHELLGLVDYERHEPAIDAFCRKRLPTRCDFCGAFNRSNFAHYWTSTPVHARRSGACAWAVNFDSGSSVWGAHDCEFQVRAVRASQSFDFWHAK